MLTAGAARARGKGRNSWAGFRFGAEVELEGRPTGKR